jgi:Flp pilus assembly pilin Flp
MTASGASGAEQPRGANRGLHSSPDRGNYARKSAQSAGHGRCFAALAMPSRSESSHERTFRSAVRDTRGSLNVEYAVLYGVVGLVIALGLAAVGPRVVQQYSKQRAVLYQPTP